MTSQVYDKNLDEWVTRTSGSHGEDVSARISSRRYYAARDDETVYSWKAAHSCSANEVVFYIKNNNADAVLVIDTIQAKSSVACEFIVCFVTGTAAGGTTVTGVNSTAGSINTRSGSCTILEDNITGLTSAGDYGDIDVIAGKREVFNCEGALRIPYGKELAIMCDTAGTINVNVFGEFE